MAVVLGASTLGGTATFTLHPGGFILGNSLLGTGTFLVPLPNGFTLGDHSFGLLSYMYFGEWDRVIDLEVSSPMVVLGSPGQVGQALPGITQPGDAGPTVGKLEVDRE